MPPVLRSAARNLHPRPCCMRLDANFHCHFPRNSQQQGPPLKMRTRLLHPPTNLICPLLRPHLVSWMWQFCDPVGEENGIPHMTTFRNQNRAALHIKSLSLAPCLSLSVPVSPSRILINAETGFCFFHPGCALHRPFKNVVSCTQIQTHSLRIERRRSTLSSTRLLKSTTLGVCRISDALSHVGSKGPHHRGTGRAGGH